MIVPLGGTFTITYNVTLPGVGGTWPNKAIAYIGDAVIDTTINPQNDSSPAIANVVIPTSKYI